MTRTVEIISCRKVRRLFESFSSRIRVEVSAFSKSNLGTKEQQFVLGVALLCDSVGVKESLDRSKDHRGT